ncbi:MAG: RNHCP domain-containing protein [Patescibacteria group bacterium]
MSQQRKNFIPINEGFTCESCHAQVGPAKGTFRNHCPQCLTSKHVDDALPGDRASTCGGCMKLVRIEGTDPDNLDLIHQCVAWG